MKIAVIERIKKLPKQTEETLHDALSVLLSIEDRKSVDHYVKWIRAEGAKQFLNSKFMDYQGRGRGAYKSIVKESDVENAEIYIQKSVRLLLIYDASDYQRYLSEPGNENIKKATAIAIALRGKHSDPLF